MKKSRIVEFLIEGVERNVSLRQKVLFIFRLTLSPLKYVHDRASSGPSFDLLFVGYEALSFIDLPSGRNVLA
ncbi:MAG TPA: hypothetical protein VHT73_03730 [Thermodesulfobacteriota bacterium]|nr:hypothetical protein [Thermodesulfobacteriota bacterium]